AGWVSEGGQKPASNASIGLKTIKPEKIAAIAVVSAEVVRANPANYMDLLRPQIAEAFAIAFDRAALYNLGPDGTGTGPFDTYIAQTSKEVRLDVDSTATGNVHTAVVAGLRSEEHTSELQSRENLVCRLLLEKKKDAILLHIP